MQCAENKVDHQYHDQCDTTVPEETYDEVEDAHNDVKEKTEDHEDDHQADGDPNP